MFHENITSSQQDILEKLDIPLDTKKKLARFWATDVNDEQLLKEDRDGTAAEEKKMDKEISINMNIIAWVFWLLLIGSMVGFLLQPENALYEKGYYITVVLYSIFSVASMVVSLAVYGFSFFVSRVRQSPKPLVVSFQKPSSGEKTLEDLRYLALYWMCSPFAVKLTHQFSEITFHKIVSWLRIIVAVVLFSMLGNFLLSWFILVARLLFTISFRSLKKQVTLYMELLP